MFSSSSCSSPAYGKSTADSEHRFMPPASYVVILLITAVALPQTLPAAETNSFSPQKLPGLHTAAQISRDTNGIAHIKADDEHDVAFLQGYVHAQDRLFQMDVSRREASGTLAELVGPSALAQDVQLRALGLRRAAERSVALQSPRAQVMLQAYADGINAWVSMHPLPPEYQALNLTQFEPWTVVDTLAVVKLVAFGLSIDLRDIQATTELLSFKLTGSAAGFDGTALFFDDIERSAPFDPASTVPDASIPMNLHVAAKVQTKPAIVAAALRGNTLALAEAYLDKTKDMPVLRHARELHTEGASNEWAISSALSASGVPLLENDPHLSLGEPATWYPIHLEAGDSMLSATGFPHACRHARAQQVRFLGCHQ